MNSFYRSQYLVLLILFPLSVRESDSQLAAGKASFDVASVRPNAPQRVGQARPPLEFERCSGDRFAFSGAPLLWLIEWSYNFQESRILGFPSWVNSFDSTFDIKAKTVGEVDQEECKLLVRGLLADRFGLKTHTAMKMRPAFTLVIGKGGPKLEEVTAPGASDKRVLINGSPFTQLSHPELSFGLTMAQFARFLSGLPDVATNVTDGTGLKGIYTFSIDFARGSDEDRPSIFSAIQTQLGLKLVSGRSLQEELIVDHVERPVPNQ